MQPAALAVGRCTPPRRTDAPRSQLIGLKAKMYARKRHAEKVVMKKTIAEHSERTNRHKVDEEAPKGAVPHYLLDREQARRSLTRKHPAAAPFSWSLIKHHALNSASPRRPRGAMRILFT